MNIEVIGIDHIYIAVSNMSISEAYYDKVMPILGFRKNQFVNESEPHLQYYNRHFGFVLRPAQGGPSFAGTLTPGLHHLCFRVEGIAELASVADQFRAAGIACPDPEHFPEYAPDYHAIFFNDPDGIRLELTNYREERRRRYAEW